MSARLADVRESFWLVPAIFSIGAVAAAIGLSALELQMDLPFVRPPLVGGRVCNRPDAPDRLSVTAVTGRSV
ncbi:hypothetical protein [Micromonospora halophytica]|uniref:hypothetical protein n=1 Tax=Micromonospora halophytica TaxID=47864 RepID=UPI001481BFDC|nr:hypothetical protein [Micromonospora halophytica]